MNTWVTLTLADGTKIDLQSNHPSPKQAYDWLEGIGTHMDSDCVNPDKEIVSFTMMYTFHKENLIHE